MTLFRWARELFSNIRVLSMVNTEKEQEICPRHIIWRIVELLKRKEQTKNHTSTASLDQMTQNYHRNVLKKINPEMEPRIQKFFHRHQRETNKWIQCSSYFHWKLRVQGLDREDRLNILAPEIGTKKDQDRLTSRYWTPGYILNEPVVGTISKRYRGFKSPLKEIWKDGWRLDVACRKKCFDIGSLCWPATSLF